MYPLEGKICLWKFPDLSAGVQSLLNKVLVCHCFRCFNAQRDHSSTSIGYPKPKLHNFFLDSFYISELETTFRLVLQASVNALVCGLLQNLTSHLHKQLPRWNENL